MQLSIENFKFFKKLRSLPFVQESWLYGSRARNDNEERSDIDLAISCPKANEKDWLDIIEIIDEADTLLKIDCIRLDSLENNSLKQNILLHRICLYKSYGKY